MKKSLLVFASVLMSIVSIAQPNHIKEAKSDLVHTANSRIILGDEQTEIYLPILDNQRVALFSNQTGIVGDIILDSQGNKIDRPQIVTEDLSLVPFGLKEGTKYGPHILDVLLQNKVNVTAIFSPEHGFRGTADAGEQVSSSVDPITGVPILSLYEKGSHFPSAESMSKFDILVVDIQDVGLRYYTYYITMCHLMDACAKYNKKMVILDRPNPNGFYVDGPILDVEKYRSGVGWIPIPIVHGMTFGELALMINGEGWLENGAKCQLEVIPCKNYSRELKYNMLMRPSPNLKDMKSIYLYSSTCFFEGTVATTGRGTEYPFEIYGHPKYNPNKVDNYSNGMIPYKFIPRSIEGAKSPKFLNEQCFGVNLRTKKLSNIWEQGVDLEYIIDAYRNLDMGDEFFLKNGFFELLSGVTWIRNLIEQNCSAQQIKLLWKEDVEKFKEQRKPYLLYE